MLTLTLEDLLALGAVVVLFNHISAIIWAKYVFWRYSHLLDPEPQGASVTQVAGMEHVECPSCGTDGFGMDYCPDCGAEMEVLHDA